MQYLRVQAAEKIDARALIGFLGLASLATLIPFFIHIQWITGPIINAILILILLVVGIRSSLVVCLVPSLVALSGGLLPAILAPAVPFIMIGNVVFVLTIDWFYNNFQNASYGYWAGVLVGGFLKFIFLFSSVNLIGKLLLKQELAIKVAQLMSWPQFATAVLGGAIAWVILKFIKRI